MSDVTETEAQLRQRVLEAVRTASPLAIEGGGTKNFFGRLTQAESFSVAAHRGIVDYEPTELVVTARGGTPISELDAVLEAHGQMLAFDPPCFGAEATLGGAIACGFSGPSRPYAGAARDFVLGVRLLNGQGETLSFGGRVMKNVAGYDVSRLMTGAMGTLGVLLEVSLKVLPRPAATATLVFESSPREAIERMNAWAGKPLPISGACHHDNRLHLRLSGTPSGVSAAVSRLGGDRAEDESYWERLREHRLGFFAGDRPLWRVSVPPATPPLDLPGESLLDWGGAQRWLKSDADASTLRGPTEAAGGHATLFRGGDRTSEVFHSLGPGLLGLHRRLKNAFDPHGIFNPGRLYAAL